MKNITAADVARAMDEFAPRAYAESFDNTGLLTGEPATEITGILVTHDCLEEVVDEAAEKGCNMIVSFHPIIFSGLKSLTGRTYVERAVMKAIRLGISIYAVHTALDNSFHGVNAGMCRALGLSDRKILIPQEGSLKKITAYVPAAQADDVRRALFSAGAGAIGNYDSCSYNLSGTGTFRALEGANPFVGDIGELHHETEEMISAIFPRHCQPRVIKALLSAHPYEEPAFEIIALDNTDRHIGMGMTGMLPGGGIDETDFLHLLRDVFDARGIRYSAPTGRKIKKVAVLGGSGSFALKAAIAAGADAFVSADFKYHDFFGAENRILIADIGHFESERHTKNILFDYLSEKFTNFAVRLSDINTNPINYLQ